MAAVLVRVDVVEDDQGVAVEMGGDGLSRRTVDDVKDGLEREGSGVISEASCETFVLKPDPKGRLTVSSLSNLRQLPQVTPLK